MGDQAARAGHVLKILQSSGLRGVQELAERMGVGSATIKRDVSWLRSLGIPIATAKGPSGGYRLAAGPRLPPFIFDEEEAFAVIVGLLHVQSFRHLDPVAVQTALAKVRRSTSASNERRLTALSNPWARHRVPEPLVPDAELLLTVASAVREERPLLLRYTAMPATALLDGHPRSGLIRTQALPLRLDVTAEGASLVAAVGPEASKRRFRLARILSAEMLPPTSPSP